MNARGVCFFGLDFGGGAGIIAYRGTIPCFSPPLQGEGWVGMGFGSPVIAEKARFFVISAKALTSSSRRKPGSSSLLLALGVLRETRLTSLCFFTRHPWRAIHFLLLAQEKVTKEKGTPEGAVGRCSRPTARVRSGGSLTAHSLCRQRTRARPARAPTGFFLRALAAP